MKDQIGYRVRIVVLFDCKGSYEIKDEFFESYEGAYLLFNCITLVGVRDALDAPSTPREAYISLNAIDKDGIIIESKKNKHRLLVRI